jgi:hypothetical protein
MRAPDARMSPSVYCGIAFDVVEPDPRFAGHDAPALHFPPDMPAGTDQKWRRAFDAEALAAPRCGQAARRVATA